MGAVAPPARVWVAPMTPDDIDAVRAIDERSFPSPWRAETYLAELRRADAVWLVARAEVARAGPGTTAVVGYGGIWLIVDEAHVCTLAVAPGSRGRGVGRALLAALLATGRERGALLATLEVRPSNRAAIALYQGFGFVPVGLRPRYYGDGEDALIMTSPGFDAPRR